MNLITKSSGDPESFSGTVPLSLTIRPACGLPGDYQYRTDSSTLMKMLRKHTDLSAYVIQNFEENLCRSVNARLLGVELSEQVLTEIGYFID